MPLNDIDWQIAVAIVFIILGLILFIFVSSLVRHQRKFIQLQKQRMKAELEALENERKRVANDLHDGLGPFLSAVKLQINSLDTAIPSDVELIKKVSDNIDSIVKNIRTIANNLMTTILHKSGLHAALLDFFATIQTQSPLKINYYNDTELNLSVSAEINIYRILQELVNNTIKHANCTELLVKIYTDKKQLIILTQDNGQGFDIVKQKETGTKGLGLKNLETRAEILNGSMEIKTEVGKGVIFIFEFLLKDITHKN
jgi:two-component system, NarL family, sensor kinase